MTYLIFEDDLLGHSICMYEYDNIDQAREAFKSYCYRPAQEIDYYVSLQEWDDDGDEWVSDIDEYFFTRLDLDD